MFALVLRVSAGRFKDWEMDSSETLFSRKSGGCASPTVYFYFSLSHGMGAESEG